MELIPYHIKLLPIDEHCTLFFHTETMQVYPLTDQGTIDFLSMYSTKGRACTETCYSTEQFEYYYSNINTIINTSPKLNSIEFDKNSVDDIHLDQIVLPIAAHCTLKCPYCFAQTEGQFNFRDFEKEDVEKIINIVMTQREKNSSRQPLWLIFFGGEPLLRFDIIQHTIKYVREKYPEEPVFYSITTNGTIINDEIIQTFKENNFAVLVSVDGPDNEFNLRKDAMGKSSFERVMHFINLMKENDINLELRATIVNTNPYIVETYDFFEQLAIPFFISFAYSSENNEHPYSDYNTQILDKIRVQFDKLVEYYVKRIEQKKNITNRRFYQYGQTFRFRKNNKFSCTAGRNYWTINADGDLFACAHYMNNKEHVIGNITDLGKVDSSNYRAIEIADIEECRKCWAKYICLGHCIAQKITLGKQNDSALPQNECLLEQLQIELYLKLFYYAQTIQPFTYFEKEIETNNPPV